MTSLPFIQPPAQPEMRRCGNEQTGVLEFPILGGLTVGESQIINQLSGSQESSLLKAQGWRSRLRRPKASASQKRLA